ncbi:MAG: DUF1553 domain-containing protein [Planctomycetaceae bacterium]
MRLTVPIVCLIGLVGMAGRVNADDAADGAFFESKVRPLLVTRCLECHGSEKPKAGLKLDSREAILAGGESGAAAVSGKPAESLLIDVIGYRNTVQMPPKAKLPEGEIAILTEWVRRGLPWPNSKPSSPAAIPAGTADFTDEQKSFWAFQPVGRPLPPVVKNDAWVRSPVDRFILNDLETRGLSVAREADRRTLIRRVTIDLTGLLPTPDEVSEFVADASPDALERLIDRLLASPRYGERWGRHWLDLARYADSNGLDENLAYANAFHYRDYVIRSIRADKPYDRFLTEQIAGDLLEVSPTESDADRFDPLIATGFLCLGAKMLAEDDPVKMQMDIIDEQVDTIARAVMGMTMGCARCHDHKYDPLTTEDYYGIAGVFKSTQTMDTFTVVARWHERPLATADQLKYRDELQQSANLQKQAVEKIRQQTLESVMTEARNHVGDYLLAATRDFQRAELAKPRGDDPNVAKIAGAILIEAEDYARGNVLKDRESYGKGIGVLVNRGETPNFTEYDVDVASPASYQLELRYAAASSRPVKVSINGQLVKPDAAGNVTGSWTPESQKWFVECVVSLKAGRNVIRLEQPVFFPHIDKLLLTPAEIPSESSTSPKVPESIPSVRLIPSLQQQWTKVLVASKSDPKSILTAWHQYMATGKLTVDNSIENGVARLLGDAQPSSLVQLSTRYQKLFSEAHRTWDEFKASDAGKGANALPDAVLESARLLLIDPKGPMAVPADIESHFPAETVTQLKEGREELARREKVIPKFSEVMAVADSKPENLKIHLRGSHLTLGREVPRQLPRLLSGKQPRELADGSGRLQLAKWLASREHPLTSRVMANRIWQWHFGHGLVRSPDNFGKLGERPSNPALLDWLASEFSGTAESPRAWSLKGLHRKLMSSATYRQGTDYNPAAALADPENRLMWRFNRQRMDVEVLRDSLLALSGQLDESPGGSLLPTANRAYVTSTANVNPAVYNSNRRSVYLPVVRSALYEVFTAFDFADPSTLAGQRDQTTVAPQALFMMNSQFVFDQSRVLAERLQKQEHGAVEGRIRHLYNLAYGRDPSEAEVSRGTGYLEKLRTAMTAAGIAATEIESKVWTSYCRAILSANEFVYVE